MSTQIVGHTPGPWFVEEDYHIRSDSESAAICSVYMSDDFPCIDEDDVEAADAEAQANARLIAAAPELLEAAKAVVAGLEERIRLANLASVPVFNGIANLSAAIAKAEGQ